jgi:plastocyanin
MSSFPSFRATALPVALATIAALSAGCRSPRPTYARWSALTARDKSIAPNLARESPVGAGKAVRVELTEWKVALVDAPPPAGSATFQVHNGGSTAHALEVEGNGIETRTQNIAPDSTVTLTVALSPGHYEIYCPVAGGIHKQHGMVTQLHVDAQ